MTTATPLPEKHIYIENGFKKRALDLKMAEASLVHFWRCAWEVIEPATPLRENWHHYVICEALEAAYRGEFLKGMINLPPGTTKSSIAICFQPWSWIDNPSFRWMFGSHTDTLAYADAEAARNIIKSDWYQSAWGGRFKMSKTQAAKGYFHNDKTGRRLSFGLGVNLQGFHANGIFIDDPHDAQKAEGAADRTDKYEKLSGVLSTRPSDFKKSFTILMGQRTHVDDVFGQFKEKTTGWTSIVLPMEYEPATKFYNATIKMGDPRSTPGELLWPDRFGPTEVQDLKRTLGTRRASAQLDQKPQGSTGEIIQLPWFGRYDRPLDPSNYWLLFQTWDTAVQDKDDSSGWACLTFGFTEEAKCDILDCLWRQVRYPDGKRLVASEFLKWHPHYVVIENKSSGQTLLQESYKDENGDPLAIALWPYEPHGDKVARAEFESPLIEAGNVRLPNVAPWLADFEEAIIKFPGGLRRDIIDALTCGLEYLRKGGYTESAPRERRIRRHAR